VTSDTDFKVTTFFDIEYLKNDTTTTTYTYTVDRAKITIERIGSRIRSIEW